MWRPQSFAAKAKANGVPDEVIANAIAIAKIIQAVNPRLPPVFSLRHLSYLSGSNYSALRDVVGRRVDAYRIFRIRKRGREGLTRGFRVICVPDAQLLRVKSWLAHNVLVFGMPHAASVAYAPECDVVNAAAVHCGSRWLIKIDITNFFESISEIRVYRAFRSLGYQALVAFELTRLCTRLGSLTHSRRMKRWATSSPGKYKITTYTAKRMGHLPQGAPTSPMLANLAVRDLDEALDAIAKDKGMAYTRYADDLTFSTGAKDFTRNDAQLVIGQTYQALASCGFSPNTAKTHVASPGARKIVLGLLVNGSTPRLTREFRARVRQHLHYLRVAEFGPSQHAKSRGFASIQGLKDHIGGLIAYAYQVEPKIAGVWRKQFDAAAWPY